MAYETKLGTADGAAGGAERQRRWAPKTKTGCAYCKAKRVKCDEGKPQCQKCVLKGRKCIYFSTPGSESPIRRDEMQTAVARVPDTRMQFARALLHRKPASLPQFNSSADVRDLMNLAPLVTSKNRQMALDSIFGIADYIRSRGMDIVPVIGHLPSRAGYEAALDDAVHCVAVSLREYTLGEEILSPPSKKSPALYVKALQSLQEALKDPKRSKSAEVLCATELLGIFETIRGDRTDAAVLHSKGASNLIQHRGPQRFRTDFELALLISQLSVIETESFWDSRRSFLDSDEWLGVLRAAISSDPHVPDRSEGFLFWHIHILPTLTSLAQCTALVMDTEMTPAEKDARRLTLLEELEVKNDKFISWCDTMRAMKPEPPRPSAAARASAEAEQLKIAYETLLTRWSGVVDISEVSTLMQHRIAAALGGTQPESERESLRRATQLLAKYSSHQDGSLQHATRMVIVPNTTALLRTSKEWYAWLESPVDGASNANGRLVPRDLYVRWLGYMGIRTSWPQSPASSSENSSGSTP